jgi:hypothetical protein
LNKYQQSNTVFLPINHSSIPPSLPPYLDSSPRIDGLQCLGSILVGRSRVLEGDGGPDDGHVAELDEGGGDEGREGAEGGREGGRERNEEIVRCVYKLKFC